MVNFPEESCIDELLHLYHGFLAFWYETPFLLFHRMMIRVHHQVMCHHFWINPKHIYRCLGEDISILLQKDYQSLLGVFVQHRANLNMLRVPIM